jgi:hypothetical protein
MCAIPAACIVSGLVVVSMHGLSQALPAFGALRRQLSEHWAWWQFSMNSEFGRTGF